MPRKDRTSVTLPNSVALSLRAERDRLTQACEEGRREWPETQGDEIPLHAVITELLRFKHAHMNRSRRAREKGLTTPEPSTSTLDAIGS